MQQRDPRKPLNSRSEGRVKGGRGDVGDASQTSSTVPNLKTKLDEAIVESGKPGIQIVGALIETRNLEVIGEGPGDSIVEVRAVASVRRGGRQRRK